MAHSEDSLTLNAVLLALLALAALATLAASLADQIALHSSQRSSSPHNDHQQIQLHHQVASVLQERAEVGEALAGHSQSHDVAEEGQNTRPEAHVRGDRVAARELLPISAPHRCYVVIRGQEAQNQHEVGVQKVIQRPDHIEAVVDHHAGGDNLRHVVLVRPALVEVALLLPVKSSLQGYQRQTRGEAHLEHNEQSGQMKSAVLESKQTTSATRTRDITEPRNTFSRQLPTAMRSREASASICHWEIAQPPKRRRSTRKPAPLAEFCKYSCKHFGWYF